MRTLCFIHWRAYYYNALCCKSGLEFKRQSSKMLSGEYLCIDGRTYPGHRDPPGQASVYIAPGDERQETYRLFTFGQFPNGCPVAPAKLAAAGFHYTGFRDRVKCFSCGLCVENWIAGDDASDKRWHRSDCEFTNGTDNTNQPIRGFTRFLKMPQQRSPSLNGANYIPEHSQNTNSNLVISGGNFVQETVPVEFRNGANETTPNRGQLPLRHSPVGEARSSSPTERTRELLYPCNHPVNPHFSSVIMRLESFKPRNGVRWPREKLRAGIDDLVNAGFFFLGEGDRVKCWYCNGGLQNWDYEDDPFTEHAKWFPSCEYVLRVKGPVFVENIVAECPNLRRPTPTIVRPTSQHQTPPEPSPISPRLAEQQSSQQRTSVSSPPTVSPPRPATHPLTVIEAVEQAMTNLDYIRSAKDMGFEDVLIKEVLKRKYESNAQFYTTAEEFLEALFAAQDRQDNAQQSERSPEREIASAAGEESSSMLSQLQRLEETRLCKVCKKEVSNVVLIPCGHLSCCDKCIPNLRRCPVCQRLVQDTIKTFRA